MKVGMRVQVYDEDVHNVSFESIANVRINGVSDVHKCATQALLTTG